MRLQKHSLIMIVLVLLLMSNSVSAVWIYPDVDIIVGDFTLNTKSAQNFTYVEIGDSYTNLSWDGSAFHNITFVTDIQVADTPIPGSGSTTVSVDVYSPSDWTVHNINMSFITANNIIDSIVIPTGVQHNATHKRYSCIYFPSGLNSADYGLFDVNVSLWNSNATLTYDGFKVFSNVFTVAPILFSGETPEDGAVGENLQSTTSITVTEVNGDSCVCDLYTSANSSVWTHVQHDSTVLNESISCHYAEANSYYTTYYWKVCANNTAYNVSTIYHFKTETQPTSVHICPTNVSINGPNSVITGVLFDYVLYCEEDSSPNDIYYKVYWGDGNIIDWFGPYNAYESTTISHTYGDDGTFSAVVEARIGNSIGIGFDSITIESSSEAVSDASPDDDKTTPYRLYLVIAI